MDLGAVTTPNGTSLGRPQRHQLALGPFRWALAISRQATNEKPRPMRIIWQGFSLGLCRVGLRNCGVITTNLKTEAPVEATAYFGGCNSPFNQPVA